MSHGNKFSTIITKFKANKKKIYFLIFQNTKVLLPENNEKAKSINSFQKGSGEHMQLNCFVFFSVKFWLSKFLN